ncbi:hypothetical protein D9619_007719 [Psilocybe cf. subviscida]|uniref:Nephrocystin 3-like N-terminal domain-containing protein n=1 Tax=Psilocybe cf. subviscida TaxID=2480587 RepID=A0A8H5ESP2_9AGAR|nr:hypothetical protein D9619_007719 [Psilocybe cf. subviscida]
MTETSCHPRADVPIDSDIVALLHSHSATAGLLDAKERFDSPKCGEGTRTSMILGMKKFVEDGGAASSPALYWLHGPAGVGKSALAQSVSLELKSEGNHAASFFFSRASPGRNNGNQLIVTLAYQLATIFPELQYYMLDIVKTNPAILTASNAVQMQSLIIDPINKWQGEYIRSFCRWVYKIFGIDEKPHPRLILVDGLDECNDRNVQRDLIICIASAVRQLSIPLRFVIASRSESHILATFELNPAFQDLNGVKVTKKNLGDDGDVDEQITMFLLKEFAEIHRVHPIRGFLPKQWPYPDQIQQLVSKSSHGFIYPTTVIQYIKMDHNRPDECLERILGLSAIPTYDKPYELLDCLYHHIFQSVPDINKTSIHEIFHFMVLPSTWDDMKSPSIIERHFDYKPGHVQHVLHDLLCLVAFTDDGCINVLHASLPDFFLDQSRSGPLHIAASDAHATIAASYLLDIMSPNVLLDQHKLVAFLKHLMQANSSNMLMHHRILEMDLISWYKRFCYEQLELPEAQSPHPHSWFQYTQIKLRYLSDIESPANTSERMRGLLDPPSKTIVSALGFMVAYLLVVVIRTPLFRKWTLTLYDKYINYIFAFEVPTSQYQIQQDIFELHFLITLPFCGVNKALALQLIGTKVEKEATEPINWADVVGGRAKSNWTYT